MRHHWVESAPGAYFCARCGVESSHGAGVSGPCNPPPICVCKHAHARELEPQKQPPFGVVIVAAFPGAGNAGARFEMNCCRRCWLAVCNLVGDLEQKS